MKKGYKRFLSTIITILVSFNLIVSPTFFDVAYGSADTALNRDNLVPAMQTDGDLARQAQPGRATSVQAAATRLKNGEGTPSRLFGQLLAEFKDIDFRVANLVSLENASGETTIRTELKTLVDLGIVEKVSDRAGKVSAIYHLDESVKNLTEGKIKQITGLIHKTSFNNEQIAEYRILVQAILLPKEVLTKVSDAPRKPIVGGNWKMELLKGEVLKLLTDLFPKVAQTQRVDIVLAPTSLHLDSSVRALRRLKRKATPATSIVIAAQNMSAIEKGPRTSQLSPTQLKELGVEAVILGHSEVRTYEFESNSDINAKVHTAIKHGLLPIVCVGETLNVREAEKTYDIVGTQIVECLAGLTAEQVLSSGLVIAYEPVWAIGTGRSATPEDADEIQTFIRAILIVMFGENVASKVRIQYGGSVKPDNIASLITKPNIDGALVGGASLNAESFSQIVEGCIIKEQQGKAKGTAERLFRQIYHKISTGTFEDGTFTVNDLFDTQVAIDSKTTIRTELDYVIQLKLVEQVTPARGNISATYKPTARFAALIAKGDYAAVDQIAKMLNQASFTEAEIAALKGKIDRVLAGEQLGRGRVAVIFDNYLAGYLKEQWENEDDVVNIVVRGGEKGDLAFIERKLRESQPLDAVVVSFGFSPQIKEVKETIEAIQKTVGKSIKIFAISPGGLSAEVTELFESHDIRYFEMGASFTGRDLKIYDDKDVVEAIKQTVSGHGEESAGAVVKVSMEEDGFSISGHLGFDTVVADFCSQPVAAGSRTTRVEAAEKVAKATGIYDVERGGAWVLNDRPEGEGITELIAAVFGNTVREQDIPAIEDYFRRHFGENFSLTQNPLFYAVLLSTGIGGQRNATGMLTELARLYPNRKVLLYSAFGAPFKETAEDILKRLNEAHSNITTAEGRLELLKKRQELVKFLLLGASKSGTTPETMEGFQEQVIEAIRIFSIFVYGKEKGGSFAGTMAEKLYDGKNFLTGGNSVDALHSDEKMMLAIVLDRVILATGKYQQAQRLVEGRARTGGSMFDCFAQAMAEKLEPEFKELGISKVSKVTLYDGFSGRSQVLGPDAFIRIMMALGRGTDNPIARLIDVARPVATRQSNTADRNLFGKRLAAYARSIGAEFMYIGLPTTIEKGVADAIQQLIGESIDVGALVGYPTGMKAVVHPITVLAQKSRYKNDNGKRLYLLITDEMADEATKTAERKIIEEQAKRGNHVVQVKIKDNSPQEIVKLYYELMNFVEWYGNFIAADVLANLKSHEGIISFICQRQNIYPRNITNLDFDNKGVDKILAVLYSETPIEDTDPATNFKALREVMKHLNVWFQPGVEWGKTAAQKIAETLFVRNIGDQRMVMDPVKEQQLAQKLGISIVDGRLPAKISADEIANIWIKLGLSDTEEPKREKIEEEIRKKIEVKIPIRNEQLRREFHTHEVAELARNRGAYIVDGEVHQTVAGRYKTEKIETSGLPGITISDSLDAVLGLIKRISDLRQKQQELLDTTGEDGSYQLEKRRKEHDRLEQEIKKLELDLIEVAVQVECNEETAEQLAKATYDAHRRGQGVALSLYAGRQRFDDLGFFEFVRQLDMFDVAQPATDAQHTDKDGNVAGTKNTFEVLAYVNEPQGKRVRADGMVAPYWDDFTPQELLFINYQAYLNIYKERAVDHVGLRLDGRTPQDIAKMFVLFAQANRIYLELNRQQPGSVPHLSEPTTEISVRIEGLAKALSQIGFSDIDTLSTEIARQSPKDIAVKDLSFMVCSDGVWIVGPEQEEKSQVFIRISADKTAVLSDGITTLIAENKATSVSEIVDIGNVTKISVSANNPFERREMIRQIVANLITEKKEIAGGLTYEEPAYSITPLMQRFIFGAKLEIEFLKGFEKAAEKARTQYPELAALIEHLKDPHSGPFKLEITKELAAKWNLKKGLADVVKAMAPIAVAGMRNSQNPLAPFDLNSPMNILLTLLLGNELAETALKIAAEQEATMAETIIGGEVRYNTPLVSEMLRRRFAKLGITVHSPAQGTYLPIGATSFITTVLNIMFTMYDTASHSARNIYASKLMGNLRPPISPFIEANLEKLGIDVKAYRRARSEGAQLLIEDMVALADNIGRKIDGIFETGKPLIIEFAAGSDEHIHFDIENPDDANNIPVSDKYAKYLRGSYVTPSNIQAIREALANGLKIGFDQARGSAYQFFRGVFEKVFNRETVGKIVWTGTIPDSFFGDTGMTDFNQKQPPDEFVKRYVERISTKLDEFFGNLPLTYALLATISERELASNIGETPRQGKENDVVNIKFKIFAKEEEGLLKRLGVPYRKLANSNLLAYYRPKMADISEDVSLLQVVAASKLPVFMLNQSIGFVYPTTDPDGDRFVLMQVEKNDKETKERLEHLNVAYLVLSDEKILAVYVPNQTFLQIQDAYIEQLKEEGKWKQNIEDPNAVTFFSIKTTVSSSAWLELSNAEGIPVVQVPVGFKEIGAIMRKVESQLMINEVRHKLGLKPRMVVMHDIFGNPIRLGYNPRLLFAGEESGGMVVGSTELLTTEDGLRSYLSWREKNAVEASVLTFIMISKRFNKAREAALKRGVNETSLYQDAEFLQDISLSNMLQKIIEQKQMQNTAELRTDVDLVDALATAQATPDRRKEMLDVGFEWRDNNFAFFLSLAFALENGHITLNDVKAILKEVLVKDEVMVAKIKAVTDDKAPEDLLKQIDDLQRYLFTGDAVYMEFSNGTWEIIRPSGTEARIKSYPSTADARISAILSNAIGEVHPKMFFELAKGDTEAPDMPNTTTYIAKMRTNNSSLIDRDKILDRKQVQYQRGLEVDTMPAWFSEPQVQQLLEQIFPETTTDGSTVSSVHIFLGPKSQKESLRYDPESHILYVSWEFDDQIRTADNKAQLLKDTIDSSIGKEVLAGVATPTARGTGAPVRGLRQIWKSFRDKPFTLIDLVNDAEANGLRISKSTIEREVVDVLVQVGLARRVSDSRGSIGAAYQLDERVRALDEEQFESLASDELLNKPSLNADELEKIDITRRVYFNNILAAFLGDQWLAFSFNNISHSFKAQQSKDTSTKVIILQPEMIGESLGFGISLEKLIKETDGKVRVIIDGSQISPDKVDEFLAFTGLSREGEGYRVVTDIKEIESLKGLAIETAKEDGNIIVVGREDYIRTWSPHPEVLKLLVRIPQAFKEANLGVLPAALSLVFGDPLKLVEKFGDIDNTYIMIQTAVSQRYSETLDAYQKQLRAK